MPNPQRLSAVIRLPIRLSAAIRQVTRITGAFSVGILQVGWPTFLLTQSEYDALAVKTPGTYYYIRG